MKKEKFLELASQLFDQTNELKEEEKIQIESNHFDEIVDQIGSEINDLGIDLIENYELEMYSNEVNLESVTLDYGEIQKTIKNVLERYFTTFG
jgi:DNA polymerase III sliding clamp (beta) subunit (PCNA family)